MIVSNCLLVKEEMARSVSRLVTFESTSILVSNRKIDKKTDRQRNLVSLEVAGRQIILVLLNCTISLSCCCTGLVALHTLWIRQHNHTYIKLYVIIIESIISR